ncbi:MAG TPA: hypothetical protein O0X39_06620 [Methanocorpusculum sp.]|nr:hypothetical protein [Methanocorpusculum sp.]
MEDIRKELADVMWNFICGFAPDNPFEYPIVKFADAGDAEFPKLKNLITPEHFMPSDYLPNAKSVLSYVLPIRCEVALGNTTEGLASKKWSEVYLLAGKTSAALAPVITDFFAERGYTAVFPENAGMISERALSIWSQRHVAWIAGHGTFGLNNMLISDVGSVVRYYSMITDMPVKADPRMKEERCLYKKDGTCGVCVKRCKAGALSKDGFDRFKCLAVCLENEAVSGADVCGKCIADVPCSFLGRC